MEYVLRVVSRDNSTALEINRKALDLLLRVFVYINNNPLESDFFAIISTDYTEQQDFEKLFADLKTARGSLSKEDGMLSLILSRKQYSIFQSVLWYGSNFGDDIDELEAFHDDLCDVHDLIR